MVMTSALHAEGREFNPPLEYFFGLIRYVTCASGVSVTLKLPKL